VHRPITSIETGIINISEEFHHSVSRAARVQAVQGGGMRRAALVTVWVCAVATGRGTASAGQVTMGIKGGAVAARIEVNGGGSFDTSPDAGLAIGGSAAIAIGPTVRIQPELLFTEARFGSSDFPLPLTVESRAFDVPVLL